MTEFEIFARDHARHNHCLACGGCLLDPSHLVQGYPCWCVTCRDRIKASCSRNGLPLPWRGGFEFVPAGTMLLAAAEELSRLSRVEQALRTECTCRLIEKCERCEAIDAALSASPEAQPEESTNAG